MNPDQFLYLKDKTINSKNQAINLYKEDKVQSPTAFSRIYFIVFSIY